MGLNPLSFVSGFGLGDIRFCESGSGDRGVGVRFEKRGVSARASVKAAPIRKRRRFRRSERQGGPIRKRRRFRGSEVKAAFDS